MLTTIGVDGPSQVHVAAAVDLQGRMVAECSAGTAELDGLVGWVHSMPGPRLVAVEGAKGYGRLLTQRLLRAGESVVASRRT